ncbi:nicotinamidase [Folsomia candida]|uniref:nicotinamidase n=1 Tax=Folsomia candida TaxID=158441 RepID=UPI00160506AC|nr:nicotinamidase [Folsomia candida]
MLGEMGSQDCSSHRSTRRGGCTKRLYLGLTVHFQLLRETNGEEVVEPINRLLDSVEFKSVYYTLDWHPENHISFLDNINQRKLHFSSKIPNPDDAKLYDTVTFEGPPVMEQTLWPRHCVQNSWGAKMHANLKIIEGSRFIYKGTNPNVDSYSAFWDNLKLSETGLINELESTGVTDCYVCGLAYNVCVGATALHALELGYRTVLINDASRGISLEDIQATKEKLSANHGVVIHSDQVKDIVQGRDRRPELGLKLALEIRKQVKR